MDLRVLVTFVKLFQIIEFSLNYAKLATLAIKAYIGKCKINSAKMLPLVEIEPGTSCDPL